MNENAPIILKIALGLNILGMILNFISLLISRRTLRRMRIGQRNLDRVCEQLAQSEPMMQLKAQAEWDRRENARREQIRSNMGIFSINPRPRPPLD